MKNNIRTMAVVGLCFLIIGCGNAKPKETTKTYVVAKTDLAKVISATGNVQPQNRLEIKPTVAGRVEKIFVKEGDMVKVGQALASVSSTDRAAILDAARMEGADKMEEWEEVYKPSLLLSPIDGQVIVKAVNPGQSVGTADPIVVLSDRLIVQAEVDETDIGLVKEGQRAKISLDAYPDITVEGQVDHIYYESKLVNNVTIYKVDILPDNVPEVFRSGMSANIDMMIDERKGVLAIPKEYLINHRDKTYVRLAESKQDEKEEIRTGLQTDTMVEVKEGLKEGDVVRLVVKQQAKEAKQMSSPFMPQRPPGSRGGRNNP